MLRGVKQVDHQRSSSRRASAARWRRRVVVDADAEGRPPARPGQDAGRHRVRGGARDARAGHGARPQRHARSSSGRGCRRPASSCCTGFRSWRGPRPTATSIPSGWWSCRAAAPRRGTATSRRTTRTSSRSSRPTSSAGATSERIVEQQRPAEARRVSSFDREIIDARASEARAAGRRAAAPVADVPAVRPLLAPAAPVTLVEAFSRVLAAAAGDADRRARAAARALRRREVLRQHGAARRRRRTARSSPSYLTELTQHVDVVLLNTGHRFDDHQDFPPALRGRVHTIEHLMTPREQPGGADRGDPPRRGVRRHLRRLLVPGAAAAASNTLAFYSHPSGFRFDHLEVAKRVFSGAALRHLHRARSARRRRRCASASAAAPAVGPARSAVKRPRDRGRQPGAASCSARRRAARAGRASGRARESVTGQRARHAQAPARACRDRVVNAVKGWCRAVRRPLRAAARAARRTCRSAGGSTSVEWSVEREIERLVVARTARSSSGRGSRRSASRRSTGCRSSTG